MNRIKRIIQNRMVRNASWLMLGRIFHIIINFFVGILTARYLGPSNYGIINYAAAYATFFTSFCTLGINSVIVKILIDNPKEEGEALGSSIVMRMISSILSLMTIVGIVSVIDHSEPLSVFVTFLYSISLLFQVFDTFNYWFQARLLSKYFAIATLVSYSIASAYKVLLLAFGMSVEWFAISNSVDSFFVALFLYIFYKKKNGPKLSFSMRKSKEILADSYNYILPGLMVSIYAATDKLMLEQMMSKESVGYYSLAVQISLLWAFVLGAIIDSLRPTIMEYHNTDKKKYLLYNRRLYALVFYVSVAFSAMFSIIAPLFIGIIYGEAYLPAVQPFRVVVWYVGFSYLGVARNIWIVCERKQRYVKYIYFASAAINVALNYLLIPLIGTTGAALASLITQISTIFGVPLLMKDLRSVTRLILSGIMLKDGVLPVRKK